MCFSGKQFFFFALAVMRGLRDLQTDLWIGLRSLALLPSIEDFHGYSSD